jgi:CBS domain containing-hemolysin-like protein
MTKNPECLLSRHILSYAINNMLEGGYRNVVVVNEDRQPESVLSMLDIFKYVADHMTLEHHEEDIVRVREKKES